MPENTFVRDAKYISRLEECFSNYDLQQAWLKVVVTYC